MLDKQIHGPQCAACGSPMKLTVIEPSMWIQIWDQDLRTFACSQCKGSQRHITASTVNEASIESLT
jgi:hypothetical protein